MNDSKKWKSRLLSSSIPLEYEVAKILTDLDFSVSFDYSYFRKDGNQKKEFSTDIKAHSFFPIDAENDLDAEITILAECKYRDEGKKWLFLPDINKPDFSNFTLGYTIKSLSEFSLKKTKNNLIYPFEEDLNYALKGIEVNIITGEVFDKDIRHGISQLKFALPYLIKNGIETNLLGHETDAYPQYFISILITNAELYILNDEFSMQKIKEVNSIEEISTQVPFLVCYSDVTPDFFEHHRDIFENFYIEYETSKNLFSFEKYQQTLQNEKYGFYNSPKRTCQALQGSFTSILKEYYCQHLICNFDNFPKLLDEIIKVLSEVTKK